MRVHPGDFGPDHGLQMSGHAAMLSQGGTPPLFVGNGSTSCYDNFGFLTLAADQLDVHANREQIEHQNRTIRRLEGAFGIYFSLGASLVI